MNILKNVFNWTIGSFFRTIGRIIAFIFIGFLIFIILQKLNIDITNIFMPKLSASTLTPKSTYTNNTNHIIGQDISSFGSNNTYSFTTTPPNLYGEFLWENASTGSAVSGKAYAFSLGFQYNLTAQKYYDITINFRDRDLRSVVNTSSIYLLGGSSISGLSNSNLSLIGVTNSATSSNNTNKLVVRVYSVQAISYFVLQIYDLQNNITSVNNFGISSVSIQEVDITNSQAIINNQTNNTQNIINNNNNNTQQIIDNQNEMLGTKCSNLLNPTLTSSTTHRGITYSPVFRDGKVSGYSVNGTRTSGSNSYVKIGNLSIESGTTVKIRATNGVGFQLWNASTDSAIGNSSGVYYDSYTFTDNYSNVDFYIYTSLDSVSNGSFDIMVSKETTTWCLYGSYSSKLDDTTNAINDVNNSINNDNVDSATNKATSFFNNFTDNDHGLSSIITMPLNSIRLMLSDNCVAPHTIYKGKTISLPCGDILWSRPGANALKDFLNVVYGGFICYYLIRSFFMWVNRFKDPDNDKIEVIDL